MNTENVTKIKVKKKLLESAKKKHNVGELVEI